MNNSLKSHWDRRYEENADQSLSWTEAPKSLSYQWIKEFANPFSTLIDIGGGRSDLTPTLAADGFENLYHLELSQAASQSLQARLPLEIKEKIQFHIGSVLNFQSEVPFDFWHDRAVFHFFLEASDIAQYFQTMERVLSPEAYILMASFHKTGPEKCSGLQVSRYDAQSLFDTAKMHMHGSLEPMKSTMHKHITPSGNEQKFQYLLMKYSRSL